MKLREIEHNCDEEFAVKFLGWKWMSFLSRSTKSHELYKTGQEIRCRQLFSARQLANEDWAAWLNSKDACEATGEEPLSYAYCSSNGPAFAPVFLLFVEEME